MGKTIVSHVRVTLSTTTNYSPCGVLQSVVSVMPHTERLVDSIARALKLGSAWASSAWQTTSHPFRKIIKGSQRTHSAEDTRDRWSVTACRWGKDTITNCKHFKFTTSCMKCAGVKDFTVNKEDTQTNLQIVSKQNKTNKNKNKATNKQTNNNRHKSAQIKCSASKYPCMGSELI